MKQQDIYELSFRRPMAVTEVVLFHRDAYPYPRCPRCYLTLDREFMEFCDRCGQKLDWSSSNEAELVISGIQEPASEEKTDEVRDKQNTY